MTEPGELSTEEAVTEIKGIVNSRFEFFLKNYPVLRSAFRNCYYAPELDTWRHEVCLCLLFGMYQAAITATNHLLESFLKYSLRLHYIISAPNSDVEHFPEEDMKKSREAMEKVDNLNLATTINRACRLGIISKDDKKKLEHLKSPFRDAYSHASKRKLLGDAPVKMIPCTITDGGEFNVKPPVEVPVGNNPVTAWFAQLEHAKAMAIPYFRYLDELIRKTLDKLKAAVPSVNGTRVGEGHPSENIVDPLNETGC